MVLDNELDNHAEALLVLGRLLGYVLYTSTTCDESNFEGIVGYSVALPLCLFAKIRRVEDFIDFVLIGSSCSIARDQFSGVDYGWSLVHLFWAERNLFVLVIEVSSSSMSFGQSQWVSKPKRIDS